VISGGGFRKNEDQTGGRARVNVVCKYQQASIMEGVSSDRKRGFGMPEIRLDWGGDPFCLFAASLTKKMLLAENELIVTTYTFVRRGIGPPRPHHSKSN
jgi:hypothetical protein